MYKEKLGDSVGVEIGQSEWHKAEPTGEGVEVKRNIKGT